ncbi:MAG: beta-ketoacyl-[acyl-carrier-protein] synthase II [Chloroflexi bacterium CFX1]|nr:3-oxoacyl-[acyl-carrier-protein] synthase 2 [Anaerolineales bacterium]MCE7920711.1 beta-ketoacyl-[acyl-carrier-protein] synthase II [Chloroflexi bacterium CFX1]MCQ3954521.1 beta-ketoacyl-[acyl-carrier-protein] synthase II [Chloroflexota bacterium]MDL1920543.1 beta-ketoacyl-ACP synthase II [Chloroflexi bacterium CFX5]MCK6567417.1 beta-ketoacyl-ACP synthase II [Anaerolineales bacterium]
MQERIVITGMGTVNPLGLNVKESWTNAVAGKSGVAPITLFDSHEAKLQVHIAAEAKGFKPEDFMDAREARRRDRFEQFAIAASKEALADSGLEVTDKNTGRIGVILSSAIGGLHSLQEATLTNYKEGPRKVSPFLIPMLMPNGGAGMAAIEFGIKGPCFSVASACASGADGIGTALMMLRTGMIDAALAGASEATITSTGVAAFDRVGAMSRRNDDYSMTPQPFDKNRDGLVMGEGAAVLVLEREADAKARGAEIFAELAGYGATADAFHVTAPHEHGTGGAAAIRMALDSAGANPDEVGYINAHGTGTPLNDQAETRAVKTAFGDLAYKIPISSTKSMTGHMMGATGALEAIFCVRAIREGVLPPTIHYETPDPECDLDYIPNMAREAKISLAISNAFGFGGHNAVLAIRKYS